MLILIPAYNEEQNIGKVVKKAVRYGAVVVVDDGSTDRTRYAAQEAGATVVCMGINRGYAAALRAGYAYALGLGHDYIVQLDADGQHDPAYINRIVAPVEYCVSDVVIGSRYFHGYPIEISKAIGVMFFRLLVQITTGLRITDPTSGYQCLNRKAMEWYLNNITQYPDANAIIALHKAGLRISEIPVKMTPNPQGRSMHRGPRKIISYMFLVMADIFRMVTK